MRTLALVLLFLSPALALADPPSDPLTNFDSTKKKARNHVSFVLRLPVHHPLQVLDDRIERAVGVIRRTVMCDPDVFTERDVLFRIVDQGHNPATLALSQVMTSDPERLPAEASVAWVLNKMAIGGFRHVPVVDEKDHPVLLVSVRDVVAFLVEFFPRAVMNLPPDYDASHPRTREGA